MGGCYRTGDRRGLKRLIFSGDKINIHEQKIRGRHIDIGFGRVSFHCTCSTKYPASLGQEIGWVIGCTQPSDEREV